MDVAAVAPPTVRMLTVSRVVPARAQDADAGDVNPKVKLSFLDVQQIARQQIQQVFLYNLANADEFPSVVRRLKEALATALAVFFPLAGKLVYVEDTGDVVVDCSDPGVAFYEAEVADGGCMDVHRLVGDEAAQDHVPKLLSLMPPFDARALPTPVLSVQATWLGAGGSGGGLALATCLNHAVVDGRSLWRFIDLWASAASRRRTQVAKSLGTHCYSRAAIAAAHPRGDELAREIHKKVAPNLPVVSPLGTTTNLHAAGHYLSLGLAWRRFYLSADDIGSLKRAIDQHASSELSGGHASAPPPKPTSTFVALSALCWTSFVRSKCLSPEHEAYLAFPVDLRSRLRPPVDGGYFGVCIKKCLASAKVADLVGGGAGLLRASLAIQEAVREADATPLAGTEVAWSERVKHVPAGHLAVVAGCPKSYRLYQTADFGFGKPVLADDMPLNYDGRMLLSAGRRHGEVQVSVSLRQEHMGAFKVHVTGGPRPKI